MDTNAHAEFLRQQAAEFRAMARRSPHIAGRLQRLADQLEATANEIDGKGGPGGS